MINFALFSALATFYFTMFFTPGPNNAMLTASGMKFGFAKTLPHLIGIPLGHIFQIGLTCFGLANLFLIYPQIQFYMKITLMVMCFVRRDSEATQVQLERKLKIAHEAQVVHVLVHV